MSPWPLFLLVASPSRTPMTALAAEMNAVCQKFHGRVGFYVKNLATGETIGLNAADRFPSASTIKTAVMIEVVNHIEEGKLKWTEKLKVPPKAKRSSSMWTAYLEDGISVNIDGLTNLMMNVSDNTATVMLADRVGVENIERRMLDWGLNDTACTIHEPASNIRLRRLHQTFANMGVTSPKDMGTLLEKIYRGTAAKSPAANERMRRIMSHQYWDDFFVSQIPPDVVVCAKVGALERSRSDTAIVFGPTPYIITAYTDNAKDRSWGDNCEGHVLLRTLSRLAWKYMAPQRPYTAPEDAPRWFPTGAGVEDS
jgi:beta-lactamase class A